MTPSDPGAAMEPIDLLSLASRKTAWLAARQETVAANIANTNTPGYMAKDIVSFADVLSRTQLQLAATDSSHLSLANGGETSGAITSDQDGGFEVTESGNTVGLESQMVKAGEINRDYALTTNIVKSFHAMLMASLKE